VPETTRTPGRNEPCHCGSGRKYKQCCLEKDEAAAREARAQARDSTETPAAPAEAHERHREAPARPATRQPWKRSQNVRGGPRFTAPRKVGGS
jgi:hypothetical protein